MVETTLIQTTDVRSKVQMPRSLKWSEVTFLANWTLENENHYLQIQNLERNPDLDFVQQLADGMVRLSFDRSRFRIPLAYDEPRSRSPVDLHQPFRQPTILLRDRPASQCSSSKNLAPFPRSRRDLGPELQGVRTQSQVSTPCYIAKQDSVADQEEDSTSQDSQKPPSPSGTDMRDRFQPETEIDHQLLVIRKEFTPDMDALGN